MAFNICVGSGKRTTANAEVGLVCFASHVKDDGLNTKISTPPLPGIFLHCLPAKPDTFFLDKVLSKMFQRQDLSALADDSTIPNGEALELLFLPLSLDCIPGCGLCKVDCLLKGLGKSYYLASAAQLRSYHWAKRSRARRRSAPGMSGRPRRGTSPFEEAHSFGSSSLPCHCMALKQSLACPEAVSMDREGAKS